MPFVVLDPGWVPQSDSDRTLRTKLVIKINYTICKGDPSVLKAKFIIVFVVFVLLLGLGHQKFLFIKTNGPF